MSGLSTHDQGKSDSDEIDRVYLEANIVPENVSIK
jgi:hypothetical protein